ncbi:ABC transporter permease [Olsenella uli]|nr:ABC transporter permease [Olsenella uli]
MPGGILGTGIKSDSIAAHVANNLAKDRFILEQLVSKDFKLRYRRSVLGVIWSVLNPLLMMIIMSFVFSYFLRGSNVENYPLYLIVGNITFSLMNESTSSGLRSIIDAAPLLKKVKVDRWVFPVQKVFSAAFNFSFSLIAVAIVMLFFRVMPTWHILWMIPALALLMVFCMGVSLLIGALAVFFRDMIHLWSVVITAWTYLTPIFWDISLLTNSNAPWFVIAVVKLNPMYNYLEMMRCAIVYQSSPEPLVIALAALWAVLALIAGLIVFRKTEHKFILYI